MKCYIKKISAVLLSLVIMMLCFCACSSEKNTSDEVTQEQVTVPADAKDPEVTITLEDDSVMKAKLYYKKAPQTVSNFIYLADKGYYDGVIFHRVIKDFVIQAGDATLTGSEGENYTIKGEFKSNGFENDLSHKKGVLSMARMPNDKDSACAQFFICAQDVPYLDGEYATFGELVGEDSFKTLEKVNGVKTDASDRPVKDIKIKSINVDTFGVTYPLPTPLSGSLS